jgi:AcrR family transcriptional regulator
MLSPALRLEPGASMDTSTDRPRPAEAAGAATRERLLDAAEKLFAERGFSAVSTRMITDEAGANSAAMHYHFGSKEVLIRAIFDRRLGPINQTRERLLAEACAAREPPDISRVLTAFIGPTLALGGTPGEQYFRVIAGRASMDPAPEVRRTVFEFYDSVGKCFVAAIEKACPHLEREELFWRLACVYGAMIYVRVDNGRLQRIFGDEMSMSDADEALRHIIPFLAAGLSLPGGTGRDLNAPG